MWHPSTYRRLVRASAWYDLLVTAPFATPWTFLLLHGALSAVASGLALPGELPTFAALPMLMANLLGSLVCIWAVLRIRHPERRLGRYDAAGRMAFALWQAYALAQGASWVILPFLVAELAWGIAQAWPVSDDAIRRD
ncbi:hypothetical protein [Pseudomonas mangiferae]|uniref:MFS transporter n=1 Tax=Pseudomonas mangiferae TaxID=2593654 RepID=A0A553H2W2_9PSED|nr:hypothetical protein [Pseudomonas mangiferae]TRX76055.1 hypothetical protein FM069_02385 [Pseudomonas mangiferae]